MLAGDQVVHRNFAASSSPISRRIRSFGAAFALTAAAAAQAQTPAPSPTRRPPGPGGRSGAQSPLEPRCGLRRPRLRHGRGVPRPRRRRHRRLLEPRRPELSEAPGAVDRRSAEQLLVGGSPAGDGVRGDRDGRRPDRGLRGRHLSALHRAGLGRGAGQLSARDQLHDRPHRREPGHHPHRRIQRRLRRRRPGNRLPGLQFAAARRHPQPVDERLHADIHPRAARGPDPRPRRSGIRLRAVGMERQRRA